MVLWSVWLLCACVVVFNVYLYSVLYGIRAELLALKRQTARPREDPDPAEEAPTRAPGAASSPGGGGHEKEPRPAPAPARAGRKRSAVKSLLSSVARAARRIPLSPRAPKSRARARPPDPGAKAKRA